MTISQKLYEKIIQKVAKETFESFKKELVIELKKADKEHNNKIDISDIINIIIGICVALDKNLLLICKESYKDLNDTEIGFNKVIDTYNLYRNNNMEDLNVN